MSRQETHPRRIALVTDSTCDLRSQDRATCVTAVVPLHVTVGGADYLDGVDITPEAFYGRFAEAGQSAHTSQPSVGEFVTVYEQLLDQYDAIVSVHIAGRLSGTVQSAALAARHVGPEWIRSVDSRQVSVGLGLVVQATGDAIAAGLDLDEVVAVAEGAGRATRVWGVTPSLEVAVQGGRVSPRMAQLANSIDLKPIIAFDEEGGAHVEGARLGFHRTLRTMTHRAARFASGCTVKAAIAHADGRDAAYYVWERQCRLLGTTDIPILQAGPVITTHVGLGAVAVAVQRTGDIPLGDTPPGAAATRRQS
jgi:DegV family protein with EDD domain